MKDDERFSESGQALVLIVLAIVALLGFTALAVDGSMVYSDRRFAQNGADAASLAGGGEAALSLENQHVIYDDWDCNSAEVANASTAAKAAAVARAQDNGFVMSGYATEADLPVPKQGVFTTCGEEPYNGHPIIKDKFLDIHTFVSHDTNTAFAHFVFQGLLRNTVQAVTRVRPHTPLAFGHAIVALNPSSQCSPVNQGLSFHGDAVVTVDGGGIFSNGCLIAKDNSLVVAIHNAGAVYGTGLNLHDSDTITLDPGYTIQQTTQPMPPESYQIDPPNCAHASAHNYTASQFWYAAKDAGGLAPGLYCVSGNVKFNSGDLAVGYGVTIVLLSGDFTINGGATVRFTAPPDYPDPTPAVPNLLIYAPPGYTGPIKLNGTSNSLFQGTILAPSADITFDGTEDSSGILRTQIIGWNVDLGGTSDLNVEYNGEDVFGWPSTLELYK